MCSAYARMLVRILSLAAIISPSAAWSQCATGVNTGGQCIPPDAAGMPGYNAQYDYPSTPEPQWADSWGAIAIDEGGDAGTISNKSTKNDATQAAMHDCQIRGARGCRIVATYRNQCAAIAWGSGGYGTATGPREDEAQADALDSCRGRASGCKIVYSACSVARRIQ